MRKYVALFTPVEDKPGAFCVDFPELDGCFTEGDNLTEAIANARECLTSYLEASTIQDDEIPVPLALEKVREQCDEASRAQGKTPTEGAFYHTILSHPLDQ